MIRPTRHVLVLNTTWRRDRTEMHVKFNDMNKRLPSLDIHQSWAVCHLEILMVWSHFAGLYFWDTVVKSFEVVLIE